MELLTVPEPGTPATRSAGRYLWWLAARQWSTLALGMVLGIVWMVAIALLPWAVGQGVNAVTAHDTAALARWALVLLALGVVSSVCGALRHLMAVKNWLIAAYRSAGQVHDHALDAGPAVTRAMPSGDVVAVFTNDVMRIGGLYDVSARFAGAIVSYVVVAAILLRASVEIGLLVLVGGPLLLGSLVLVVRPLQRRQAAQREEAGQLTTLGADTVAGLRVLRGIGGEDAFLRRYEAQSQTVRRVGWRVAGLQAALDSSQVLLPGIFVVLVTWTGARAVVAGDLTAGQLVSFYGYAAFLTMPFWTVIEFVDRAIRATIGARKVLAILAVGADHSDAVPALDGSLRSPRPAGVSRAGRDGHVDPSDLTELATARVRPSGPPAGVPEVDPTGQVSPAELVERGPAWAGVMGPSTRVHPSALPDAVDAGSSAGTLVTGDLVDPRSGVVARAGLQTAVVSAVPEASARIVDRIGRVLPDRELADDPPTVGGVQVTALPLDTVRRSIVVSESDPRLFTGSLREELLAAAAFTGETTRTGDTEILEALHVASALDVLDAVPGGLDGRVEERGRTFSGGQRQRLALARALLADPPALALVEPTSAVDAHTEARIAERLADHRRGRTTLVATASPLVLDRADEVVFVQDGVAVDRGPHADLLRRNSAYRNVVIRGEVD